MMVGLSSQKLASSVGSYFENIYFKFSCVMFLVPLNFY